MNHVLVIGLIAAWTAIVVGCWLGWQLLRQNGRVLLRLEALEKRQEQSDNGDENETASLPLGSPAPNFELPDLTGERKTLAEFLGQSVLLLFFNPACGFCRDLVPRLAALGAGSSRRSEHPDVEPTTQSPRSLTDQPLVAGAGRPGLLLISTGDPEQNRQFFAEHNLGGPILLQEEMEVAIAYKASGTPSGYLIDAKGKIASELALGRDALLALAAGKSETRAPNSEAEPGLPGSANGDSGDARANRFGKRSLAHSKLKRDGIKAGTPAPEFRLPRLEGGELVLAELRDRPVFLVFSSPHCGPCNTLAPKLEKFHRKHPQLHVVMISRGEPGENRVKVEELGLTFQVALQRQWEISRQYAIFATPAAYLIDSAGVIAADVAVGADAILDLMTRAGPLVRQKARPPFLKRMARWPVALTAGMFQRLLAAVTVAKLRIDTLELKHFKFVPRADDIFIVTYPRSGTTWMQMILYQLTTDGSMEFSHIAEKSPWFERSADSDRGYEERAGPRVFKSHLPYKSIPKGPGRYIYVMRDGRDVAVSYYHLYRSHNGYKGTFTEFFELFMRGKVMFGSWFEHVGGWWKHRHKLNVLFLSYEELVADLEGCLRRISAFCHLNVPPEKLPLIVERCSFAFMKQHEDKFDPAVEALWQQGARLSLFLRAGRVGGGSRELNQEQQARFEQAFQAQLEPVASSWPAATPLRQVVPSAS